MISQNASLAASQVMGWFGVPAAGGRRPFVQLLKQLAWRDVQTRYRGSWLGILWSVLTPLLTLALYTFVFSGVFRARWSDKGTGSDWDFALAAFAGLIVFNLFAEAIAAAPGVILNNANYVKRVVFPLEVLPLAKLSSCGFQFVVNFLVLCAAVLYVKGSLPLTLVYAPLAVLPAAFLAAGATMFLASLGVFVRDLANLIGLSVSALMFLSPVFYPLEKLPASIRPILEWNPLAPAIEGFRAAAVDGAAPVWASLAWSTAVSLVVMLAGAAWFRKLKGAFADVL